MASTNVELELIKETGKKHQTDVELTYDSGNQSESKRVEQYRQNIENKVTNNNPINDFPHTVETGRTKSFNVKNV